LFNPTVAGGNGKGGCGNSISQPYKFRLVREVTFGEVIDFNIFTFSTAPIQKPGTAYSILYTRPESFPRI
jgi:hypothetical protein